MDIQWTSGMGEVVPAHTSPNPTSPIPSHCAVIFLFKSVLVHQLSWLALKSSISRYDKTAYRLLYNAI